MTKIFSLYSAIGFTTLLLLIFLSACTTEEEKQFTLLSSAQTNIDFENHVTSTRDFNIINYMYFYDGGGLLLPEILTTKGCLICFLWEMKLKTGSILIGVIFSLRM